MPIITIDNQRIEAPEGATILEAAREAGVEIPTLCFLAGLAPAAACMVCVVKVNGREALRPACATKVEAGMVVESETPEVRAARRAALELLLGEHLGDCLGPCQAVCPAHTDIPAMLRHLAAGRWRDAVIAIKERLPLPATLGRICPAPCERGCRRAQRDGAVSICLLHRFAAEADLASDDPYIPGCAPSTGKRVAIVGAGPAGLSAAYFLLRDGHACTLFDDHAQAGGRLRDGIPDDRLPREVLDAEIGLIGKMGAAFRLSARVGEIGGLRADFDAVLLATGDGSEHVDLPGVFAAGSVVTPRKYAVQAVADGRFAALAINSYFAGAPAPVERRPFTTHIGRLSDAEMDTFMSHASVEARCETAFTAEKTQREAARCLRCDCRKAVDCRLRRYAVAYEANAGTYRSERREFTRDDTHPAVVYEPGKCIDCGICVRLAERERASLGLSFIGRGFQVRVAVPFSERLANGLGEVARACADACPTGALAVKNHTENG